MMGNVCASNEPIVVKVLERRYSISMERGQLIINQSDGTPVAKSWIKSHQAQLVAEILKQTNRDALLYIGYSADKYGDKLAGGVALQFTRVLTGAEVYAIFNANISRSRTTKHGKAGSPLPQGQFHVAKRSGFCKFWVSTGLPSRKLSSYYEYMGKLKLLYFESQDVSTSNNRLNSSLLKPLHIGFHEVKEAFGFSDSPPTSFRQATDKPPTVATDKETLQPSKTLGLQADSTTGSIYYGNTVIREKVTRGNAYSISAPLSDSLSIPVVNKPKHETETTMRAKDQTIDEWFSDYDESYFLEHGYYP